MMRNRRLWTGLAALIWLVVVICVYYASHKPFEIPLASGLVHAGWQMGVALSIVSLAGGAGRRLLPRIHHSPIVSLSLQCAAGLGLLSLLNLLVGSMLGFSIWLNGSILLLVAVLIRHSIWCWWGDWRDLRRLWKQSSRLGQALAVGVAFIFLLTMVTALLPALKFDSLVYHLALPQAYLAAGRLIYVPQIMYWGMPQVGEMLFTWAMAMGGNEAATALSWLVGLLAVVGLAGYVSDRFGSTPGWVSVATILAGFTLSNSLAWGYVDWLAVYFGSSCLIALDGWGDLAEIVSDKKPFWLGGMMAGFALGSKYTAGVLLLAAGAGLFILSKGGLRRRFLAVITFLLSAVLAFSPWLLKNLIATGNPVYPFFFPAGAMDATRIDLYQTAVPWGSWWNALILPFEATFNGHEGGPVYSASIGPLLLGLGVWAWLGWPDWSPKQRQSVALAASISLGGLIVWMIAGRMAGYLSQSRMYLVLFPAMALLAGAGFASLAALRSKGVRFGRLAGAMVLLVLCLSGVENCLYILRQGAPQALFGLISWDKYQADNLGWFTPTMQAIQKLPQGSSVLMLWEARSLYCAPRCEPDEVLDRWSHDLSVYQTPESVLQSWKAAGFTHLLYYKLGADFMRREYPQRQPGDWEALDVLLASLPAPTDYGDTYWLYALNP